MNIEELLLKYPAFKNIEKSELINFVKFYEDIYDKLKTIYDEKTNKFIENEYNHIFQLFLPYKYLKLGYWDRTIEIKSVVSDTTFLTDEEFNYINDPQRNEFAFIRKGIIDVLINEIYINENILISEIISEYPTRVLNDFIYESYDSVNGMYVLEKTYANLELLNREYNYLREIISDTIILSKANDNYYFYEWSISVENNKLKLKVKKYNDDLFNLGDVFTIKFRSNYTFQEFRDGVLKFKGFINVYEKRYNVLLSDKDEVLYFANVNEFLKMYDFRLSIEDEFSEIILAYDRDFYSLQDYLKYLGNIKNKNVFIGALYVENDKVYLVIPSREWHYIIDKEIQNINITLRASQINNKVYDTNQKITTIDGQVVIYRDDNSYVIKSLTFDFLFSSSLTPPITEITSIENKNSEIKPKTIISINNFVDTLKDDFRNVIPLDKSDYFYNIGVYREPLTFYAFVENDKNYYLSTGYTHTAVLEDDYDGELGAVIFAEHNDLDLEPSINNIHPRLPFIPFDTIKYYSKPLGNAPLRYYTYMNAFYIYSSNKNFNLNNLNQNIIDAYTNYFREYFNNNNNFHILATKYYLKPNTSKNITNEFIIDTVELPNYENVIRFISKKKIYLPDDLVIGEYSKKLPTTSFYGTINLDQNINYANLLLDVNLEIESETINNITYRYIKITFSHRNNNRFFLEYLKQTVDSAYNKKIIIEGGSNEFYEENWVRKYFTYLPPFANIKLYEITPIMVKLNYSIRFYNIANYTIKQKIIEDLKNEGMLLESFDLQELIDKVTDKITKYTLTPKITKFILDISFKNIIVFGKKYSASEIYSLSSKVIKPFFKYISYVDIYQE